MSPSGQTTGVYLDTGCGVSLIDRIWAKSELPNLKVSKIVSPLRVRGVRATKHKTSDFITVLVYFPSIDKNGNKVLVYIKREFYLVDDLRAKMLIGNNIIAPEKIVIDISSKLV